MRTLLDSTQTLGAYRRALLLNPMPSRSPPHHTDTSPSSTARRTHQPPPMGHARQQAPHVRTHGRVGLRHRPHHMEHV